MSRSEQGEAVLIEILCIGCAFGGVVNVPACPLPDVWKQLLGLRRTHRLRPPRWEQRRPSQ